MKKTILMTTIVVVSSLFLSACSNELISIKNKEFPLPTINNDNVLQSINAYRVQNYLHPLNRSDELCAQAQKRAEFLINDKEAIYQSSVGHHVGFETVKKEYTGSFVAENLFFIAKDKAGEKNYTGNHDQDVLEIWKSSDLHNKILLSSSTDDLLGIASALNKNEDKKVLEENNYHFKLNQACIGSRVDKDNTVVVFLIGDK